MNINNINNINSSSKTNSENDDNNNVNDNDNNYFYYSYTNINNNNNDNNININNKRLTEPLVNAVLKSNNSHVREVEKEMTKRLYPRAWKLTIAWPVSSKNKNKNETTNIERAFKWLIDCGMKI